MSRTQVSEQVQGVFGALLGGMIASFIAVVLFSTMLGGDGTPSHYFPLIAAAIGLTSSVALMLGGVHLSGRVPWLGTALLFASGFTIIWSVVASISVEPRWFVAVALGVAIAIGMTAGWRRFGGPKAPDVTDSAGAEAPLTVS